MCCELALRIGNYRSINKKGTRGAGRAKWSNRSRAVPTPSHSRSGHSPACHCRHGHARCPMHPRVQADVFVSLTISSASTEAAACALRPFVRLSTCTHLPCTAHARKPPPPCPHTASTVMNQPPRDPTDAAGNTKMPAVDSGRARAIASVEFFSFLAPAEYSTIIDHYDVENTVLQTKAL